MKHASHGRGAHAIIAPVRAVPHPRLSVHRQIAFLSMLPAEKEDGFHAAYREFEPATSAADTEVRYQRYSAEFQPQGPSVTLMRDAEDPRCFWRDGGYCSVIRHAEGDWEQWIIALPGGEARRIRHDLRFAGKNWAPVVGGERLLMVRSLAPLCVLEVTSDFVARQVIAEPLTRDIGPWRGGAAAVLGPDGVIRGVGHKTIHNPLRHLPFAYEIDLKTRTASFSEYKPVGFGASRLLDPTAQLGDRVLCCCAWHSWWDPQAIVTRLCEVRGA